VPWSRWQTWAMDQRPWHALTVDEVVAVLDADPIGGLTEADAVARLGRDGPNELTVHETEGAWERLIEQFSDVLIWVLLVAALVSGFLLDEWIDAGVILAIVVLNAGLGYVQEARAERALARLRDMAAPDALVVRDDQPTTVPSADLVVGDLVVIEVGALLAADIRLTDAVHLEVDESSLTGESLPSAKSTGAAPEGAALGDRTSVVFAGTSVTSGRGRGVVVATGVSTEVGQIAGVLAQDEPPTPLQVELDSVGRRLGALALATAGLVFLVGWARGNPAEAMFLTAVALAVAAIPEGLPAVVTITLARGVQRMAERNSVVRRLPAVEALGAATVVCTDKTGTITRNRIRVQEVLLADRRVEVDDLDRTETRDRRFLDVAVLCNDAVMGDDGWLGDPTEIALAVAADDAGADIQATRSRHPRVDEFAFDSARKRMSTVHPDADRFVVAVKGAPEEVVERCESIEGRDGPQQLDPERRTAALASAADLAARGLRTLALAYRPAGEVPSDATSAESHLVLVALVGMSDEIRPEAGPAVAEAQQAGITVVMVTGDHEVTARAVATQVGILGEGDRVMPGSDLRRISAEDLSADVGRYRVYSRIDPLDKVKIVEAWRSRGHIVAMTGDGVNDAPALRAADIGVAMGSGTDVSREAASMVLADDNFASIIAAVREGRGIFRNLRTVVSFLLGSNASEVLLMLTGFVVFGALGEPLLATQLLWINLITDGLPALALGVDPPAPDAMQRGPDRGRQMLGLGRLLRLARHGAVMATAGIGVLVAGHYWLEYDWETVRTMVFTSIVLIQLGYSYVIRRAGRRPGQRRNRLLATAVLTSVALQVAVVYLPLGQTLFDTVGLPAMGWIPVAASAVVAAVAVIASDGIVRQWQLSRRGRGFRRRDL
jgi:Ca2+-transporting ATPase